MTDILKKLKQRGYWEVLVRPGEFIEKRTESLAKCKEIVRETNVQLRGWDYPHYDSYDPPKSANEYVWSEVDWKYFIAHWRYYQSGQFIHFFAMPEDWLDLSPFGNERMYEPGECLWFKRTIFTFTEIYEFSARLATKGVLGESCTVSVTLHKTKNRTVRTEELSRLLFADYTCAIDPVTCKINLSTADLIARSAEIARGQATSVFHQFNWDHITPLALKEDQAELLRQR